MKTRLKQLARELREKGLDREQQRIIDHELTGDLDHSISGQLLRQSEQNRSIYSFNDFALLQAIASIHHSYIVGLQSLDELLERDQRRQEDGFPPKIRVGRLVKPGRGSKDRVVVVPTTVEEKLLHDRIRAPEEEQSGGGTGEGDEGEVIGEEPLRPEEGEGGAGPGEGEGGGHEVESNAYDLGRILTEKFSLPNLKDKGKKRSLSRYTYDLTDKHRGFGQVLDKKATLRRIVQTNIGLGRITGGEDIDTESFLISPYDKVYRILSREKDYESQAVVFFLRDYSGSMDGKPTELVVSQHVMIYSWLIYQYAHQVKSRFVLHDTDAREVQDFYTYYNSKVAGGTRVFSAFKLVNEIVSRENLARDYNIYVFYGTDGDDWDTDGKVMIPELTEMLGYANRVGITVAENNYSKGKTQVEKYLKASGLLKEKEKQIRMDVIGHDADEPRIIEGIKHLIG